MRQMKQIQLGVKRVAEKELDDELFRSDLSREAAQARFIVIRRNADRQLSSKLFGESVFQPNRGLIVEFIVMPVEAERIEKLILRKLRHSDEQAATLTLPTSPRFNI